MEKPKVSKQAANACLGEFGNPIVPLTGGKKERWDPGLAVGELSLSLTYDSSRYFAAAALGVAPKDYGDPASFGAYWFSNLHRRALISPARFGARLYRGDGSVVSFRFESGGYISDSDSADKFLSTAAGYLFINGTTNDVEVYNKAGQLITVSSAAGGTLSFAYSPEAQRTAPAAGYLTGVTDQAGRTVRFEYELPAGGNADKDGRVVKVTSSAGQVLAASYDVNGQLASWTHADGKTRSFLYENPTFPWALTGIVDENSSRLSTYGYDGSGRAISTERAGGVDRYSVNYGTAPTLSTSQTLDSAKQITYRTHEWVAPADVNLTYPKGEAVTVQGATVQGVPMLTGQSQPAGSGCTASSMAMAYDANGNLASVDDFNGHRTCFAHDAHNRETLRIEGLANTVACSGVTPPGATLPSGARRVTTTWHADWRLMTRRDEPLLRTTFVYHGQSDPFNGGTMANCTPANNMPNSKALPVLCKKVEQALDASGAVDPLISAKVSSFTYDDMGRALSMTDPRGKVTS